MTAAEGEPVVNRDPIIFTEFISWFNLTSAPDVILSDSWGHVIPVFLYAVSRKDLVESNRVLYELENSA